MVGLLDPDGADQWDLAGSDASPYVMAQGAFGSRVPADTMMDSPQFLVEPGVAPRAAAPSDKYQTEADRQAQVSSVLQQIQAVSKQMDQLPVGSPDRSGLYQRWSDLNDQFDQLHKQWSEGPIGQWSQRQVDIHDNQGADADAIMNAIQNRQAQPRQPLPSPAPGGAPYAPAPAPIVPQAPPTSGLTSFNDPVPQYLRTALARLQRRA